MVFQARFRGADASGLSWARAWLFPLLTLCLLLGACASERTGAAGTLIPSSATTSLLRKGDSLTVSIVGVPDPSENSVQIDEQGYIRLPFIGSVLAAGSSTAELANLIRDTYVEKNFYTSVDVSVSVTERYVYVGGEVDHPGRIVWSSDLTALKAIQSAGGFSLYANESKVALVRDQAVYNVNLKRAERDPTQDPRLEPGDSINVPKTAF